MGVIFNKKEPANNGLEHDVITGWRKVVASLINNPSKVKFAKRSIRRRQRRKSKIELRAI